MFSFNLIYHQYFWSACYFKCVCKVITTFVVFCFDTFVELPSCVVDISQGLYWSIRLGKHYLHIPSVIDLFKHLIFLILCPLKTNNYLNINQFIDLFKHFIFLIVCPLKNNDYLNNQIITISTPISLCNQPQPYIYG
jgi:hypothetical protein